MVAQRRFAVSDGLYVGGVAVQPRACLTKRRTTSPGAPLAAVTLRLAVGLQVSVVFYGACRLTAVFSVAASAARPPLLPFLLAGRPAVAA